MLKFNIFNYSFFRFIHSGLYVDFFLKKIIEIFIKNVFVYSSQFLGEKYMIEVLTKKIIDSTLYNTNRKFYLNNLFYSYYFINIVSIIFYFFIIINIIFLL